MEALQPSSIKIWPAWLSVLVLSSMYKDCDGTTQAEINKHLEMGRDFLGRGQLQDALSHYHAALEGDPANYLTYFKRATVYLALGKSKFALMDLDRVLELKPDFTAARLQRGNVHLKQAQLQEALRDYTDVLQENPFNEEALLGQSRVEPAMYDIQLAERYVEMGECSAAIDTITKVIEVCPWASHLRELRADCHVALGDTMSAISDIRSTTKLESDNIVGFLKLSRLLYQLGQAQESLKEIRECLRLDPEHKECFPFYKKVKKVDKFLQDMETAANNKDYTKCVEQAKKVLKEEPTIQMISFLAKQKLCHCYLKSDQLSLSIQSCREALELQKDPYVLCDRAEAYISSEMYDDAIHDYQDALEMDENLQRAKEGLQRARKLQKQAEKRDYYKILGVKRTASKQEIIKAYRKMAQKWHPDNFQGDEKKIAEKKFIDIAAAKEVLTDPDKRSKFDMGEDPLDPEAPNQHGFNPFQHTHFHGSPFQFKFHFN
ncbi:dnaJ homolog subfamily C member 3 [Schistocerca piceifrons]|uniref:dnaJ homolog subfamily C member 3 n=1 Tax=Schistocerca piceifrons TaxID=274613 RepID=UPI001F5EC5CA|nr:dnaJ homolog subfamily C member 3 [Schistocerca piceifrons]